MAEEEKDELAEAIEDYSTRLIGFMIGTAADWSSKEELKRSKQRLHEAAATLRRSRKPEEKS